MVLELLDKGLGERREEKGSVLLSKLHQQFESYFCKCQEEIVEQLCLPLELTQPAPRGSYPERSVPELLEVYQIINL